MKKIITPETVYPEASEKQPLVSWDTDAIETLQSLERYTILKAIEEGKRLIKRVMEVAAKTANDGKITKTQTQTAITSVLEEIEASRNHKS